MPPVPSFFPRSLALAACLAGAMLSFPAAVPGAPPPDTYAKAWIVVDAGRVQVLGTKNADQRRPVASTQKLLTALLIVERFGRKGLDEMVTVDRGVTKVAPYKIGVRPGEKYRRVDLLKSLLIKSGNDIAHVLGVDYAGSEEQFARAMTARARQLGMLDSQFRNASGLPDDAQYSTARDMARLALYIYRDPELHPVIIGITRMRGMTFTFNSGRTRKLTNTNKLLTRLGGCNGMKTGYTNASGRCLVSSVNRNGRHLIAVVLGSSSKHIWNDSQRLLEWGLTR